MANILQGDKGEADIEHGGQGSKGFVNVSIEYSASSVDKVSFVAPRRYIVKSIVGRPTVAGTDAGAVTAVIKKAASGTAITAGTALHSGTYDLKGTANTIQTLSVTAADNEIPAGTAIGIDFTGTLTSATGVVTVLLAPA
jgi:hypothetical protein